MPRILRVRVYILDNDGTGCVRAGPWVRIKMMSMLNFHTNRKHQYKAQARVQIARVFYESIANLSFRIVIIIVL